MTYTEEIVTIYKKLKMQTSNSCRHQGRIRSNHEDIRNQKRRTLSNFTVLMMHIDPFYRVGFDDVVQDHVPKGKSYEDVGRI